MRNKRMFSIDVVDTDKFLDMPTSTQALYFHLGMRADDDGFVTSPKKILAISGCNNDDLNLLIAKNFIIPFESGVIVITDWKTNNYLRGDRYAATRCIEEKKNLVEINGKYQISLDGVPDGIPNSNQCVPGVATQKRIEENRINNIVEQSPTTYPFKEIIEYLNQRTGKKFKYSSKANQKHIKARINEGYALEDFKKVIDWKISQWTGNKEMERYLRPETLFGAKFEGYLNEIPVARKVQPIEPEEPEKPIDLWSDE